MAKYRISNETAGLMVAGNFDSIDEAILAVAGPIGERMPLKVQKMDLTNCIQLDVTWAKPIGHRTFKIGQEGLSW